MQTHNSVCVRGEFVKPVKSFVFVTQLKQEAKKKHVYSSPTSPSGGHGHVNQYHNCASEYPGE